MGNIDPQELARVLDALGAGKTVEQAVAEAAAKVADLPVAQRLREELADHRIDPRSLLAGFDELFHRLEALEHPEGAPVEDQAPTDDVPVPPADTKSTSKSAKGGN